MKKTNISIFILAAFLSIGCSKETVIQQDSTNYREERMGEFSNSLLEKILLEKDEIKRAQLILNSTTSSISGSDLNKIIKFFNEKSLSINEFRVLFWNSNISEETAQVLSKKLEDVKQFSELDKVLLKSIADNNLSFEDLLIELKKDNNNLPITMQNALFDKLINLYESDFDRLNSDKSRFDDLVSLTNTHTIDNFLIRLTDLLKLTYYKKILSNNRLITKKNNNPIEVREIETKFNFNYNFVIARGGNYGGTVDFDKINTSYGRNYNTQTPANVNLDVYSDYRDDYQGRTYDVLVNSYVRGGYDKDYKENGTSLLGYNLSGKIVIPRCANPAFCDQAINVKLVPSTRSYPGSVATLEGVTVKLNGTILDPESKKSIFANISEKEAVIEISFVNNKRHVGACCTANSSFQVASLLVGPGYNEFFDIPFEQLKKTNIFNSQSTLGYMPEFETTNVLDSPQTFVILNKKLIENALRSNDTERDYRNYFYMQLLQNQIVIDYLLLKNSHPMAISKVQQMSEALSELVGRQLVLPVINAKLSTYQSTPLIYVQKSINKMFNNILLMNLKNENDKVEISKLIKEKTQNFDVDGKILADKFLITISNQANDSKSLLDIVEKFHSEFLFMTKKLTLEMEVLTLEKAQFTDLVVEEVN